MKDLLGLPFDALLFLVGVALLVFGCIGRVEGEKIKFGTDAKATRWFLAVLGFTLMSVALWRQEWRDEGVTSAGRIAIDRNGRHTVRERSVYELSDDQIVVELVCREILAKDRKVLLEISRLRSQSPAISLELGLREVKAVTFDDVTYFFRVEDIANVALGADSAEVSIWKQRRGA